MIWTIPNLLSILRMGLVPLFVLSVLSGEMLRALLVFGLAGVTDALDGAAARWWRQKSRLGAYLDPAADKLLLVAAYVVLSIPGLREGLVIPVWITALVLTRDVVIVIVAMVLYLAQGVTSFPPSPLSKLNTAMQIVAVVLVLLSGIVQHAEEVASWAVWLVAVTTLASGIDYIRRTRRFDSSP